LFALESFFGLRIELGVVDQSVDEDPQVITDLERFDLSSLVFLLDNRLQDVDDLCRHVRNVGTTTSSGNAVDETNLLGFTIAV
jgi:hypothetical protein